MPTRSTACWPSDENEGVYDRGILDSFTVAYHHATPHGVLSAVHIPDAPDPVPEAVLERLPGAEAQHARTLRGFRQVQFVGGRIALRAAASQLGVQPPPILATDRGAPDLPRGFTGSVSHKRTIAVGMVGRSHMGILGVDIEDYGPPRPAIAKKILRPEELAALSGLGEAEHWMGVLMRFSIKESIYKALDPYVGRYVGFSEASVAPDLRGRAAVTLHLEKGEGPFEVDARYEWLTGRLLTSVRIRPTAADDDGTGG